MSRQRRRSPKAMKTPQLAICRGHMIAGEGCRNSKGSGEQRTKKRGWSAGRRGLRNDGDRQEWRQKP